MRIPPPVLESQSIYLMLMMFTDIILKLKCCSVNTRNCYESICIKRLSHNKLEFCLQNICLHYKQYAGRCNFALWFLKSNAQYIRPDTHYHMTTGNSFGLCSFFARIKFSWGACNLDRDNSLHRQEYLQLMENSCAETHTDIQNIQLLIVQLSVIGWWRWKCDEYVMHMACGA